jgi:hypothetical protein
LGGPAEDFFGTDPFFFAITVPFDRQTL